MKRNTDLAAVLRAKFEAMAPVLDERARRLWCASESIALGYGGDALVSAATGASRTTVRKGRRDIEAGDDLEGRIRRPGAGRPGIEETQVGVRQALDKLVEPMARGDPMSPLRWTCKSRENLSSALRKEGFVISATKVGHLLHALGYRLQAVRKTTEGASHPDRNAQFEHINKLALDHIARDQPVISVDTKKKELVGDFKNAGREWQPKGQPERTLVHDFPDDAVGKAIPYGVYDLARDEALVNVGMHHDTPAFAIASIRAWWREMGVKAYPNATELFLTADAGGSNGYRTRAWKKGLQELADEIGLKITVSHFPPGTSKWNRIEHRLFCHITRNWRGRPLRTFEAIVALIGATTTAAGLRVKAKHDKRRYPTGLVVTKKEMAEIPIHLDDFHGEWNYGFCPRAS
jgi:hypothetical protein